MRSLLPLFISILCLVSRTLAANLPRLNRQPSPSKAFYTIFPKIGTDTSKTREFVKDIVGTEDLLPWTDLQEQLVLWTIEASPDEVAQLRGYADVDKVVEFCPAEAPADSGTSFTITRSIRDMPAVERLAERQEPVAEYLVFAKDGKNQAETNQTEQMLQNLVGKDNVDPPFTHKNQLRYWLCNSK